LGELGRWSREPAGLVGVDVLGVWSDMVVVAHVPNGPRLDSDMWPLLKGSSHAEALSSEVLLAY
jgi:hypothetical protein